MLEVAFTRPRACTGPRAFGGARSAPCGFGYVLEACEAKPLDGSADNEV